MDDCAAVLLMVVVVAVVPGVALIRGEEYQGCLEENGRGNLPFLMVKEESQAVEPWNCKETRHMMVRNIPSECPIMRFYVERCMCTITLVTMMHVD